jgi:hypothetical protein
LRAAVSSTDVTISDLTLEAFYPADEQTKLLIDDGS